MKSINEFNQLAERAGDKVIPPKYGFAMHWKPIFSPGYFDCVGVVLAGKKTWALSHYPKEGTLIELDALEPTPDPHGLLPTLEPSKPVAAVRPPIEYLGWMIEFLTQGVKYKENREDLFALPFAGDEQHLGQVIEALSDLRIPSMDPVRNHFSDDELGGAEGRILAVPERRKVFYHSVSRNKVFEYDVK